MHDSQTQVKKGFNSNICKKNVQSRQTQAIAGKLDTTIQDELAT